MLACPKSEMWIVQSLHVQKVWILELSWVPIGCSKHEDNQLSLAYSDVADFHILFGHACNELNRAFKTE
jgi:hypothetical protein